jgi:hypothetical protein
VDKVCFRMGLSITQHLHGKWTTPTWPGIILSALGGFKKIRPPHAWAVTRSCRRILSARRPCWWEDSVDTSILSLIRMQHVVYDTENDFTYNPFTYIEVTQYRRNDHARMTGTRRISQPCHQLQVPPWLSALRPLGVPKPRPWASLVP